MEGLLKVIYSIITKFFAIKVLKVPIYILYFETINDTIFFEIISHSDFKSGLFYLIVEHFLLS
jgi:hypothetical protein